MADNIRYMVCVRCMTYNQSAYIEDALNGFCMQDTSFPFVCVIVDDASTDGATDVIKEYLDNNFCVDNDEILKKEETDDYFFTLVQHKTNKNCFFAVYYLKYNHWGKKDKTPYYQNLLDNSKFVAICEGDDYWIDARKLQEQVDFLESNQTYSMVCNSSYWYSQRKRKYKKRDFHEKHDFDLRTEDVILNGGLYIATCSILYRRQLMNDYPDYCRKCHVGDYPMQIWLAIKGGVRCLHKCMSVYRVDNPNSWVGREKEKSLSDKRMNGILSEVRMLQGYRNSFPNYNKCLSKRLYAFLINNVPNKYLDRQGYLLFCSKLKKELDLFPFLYYIAFGYKTSFIYYLYIKTGRAIKWLINL